MDTVSFVTLGALYTGIFQSQEPHSADVEVECSTGNCTFGTYQSLGICSHCANITDLFQHSSQFPESSQFREYTYTLSNGLSWTSHYGEAYLINASAYLDLLRLDVGNIAIVNFTAICLSIESAFSDDQRNQQPPHATECALFFCINTYDAVVREGQFSENRTLVSTSSNATSVGQDPLRNFTLTPDVCDFNKTQPQDPDGYYYENCVYQVNAFSRLALKNSISPLLNGSALSINTYRHAWTDSIQALYGTAGSFTDIESTFESIISTLTTNARTKICNSKIAGIAWTSQPFVQVRWRWLTLPGALLALGLGFLICYSGKDKKSVHLEIIPFGTIVLGHINRGRSIHDVGTEFEQYGSQREGLESSVRGIFGGHQFQGRFRPASP